MVYADGAKIQFGPEPSRIYTTSYNLADTLKLQTFFYQTQNVNKDTVYFDIYAIGGVKDFDRSFTLQQEQIPNVDNAVSGVHFIPLNDPLVTKNYVIKAGTVHTLVPIILLRDASLKTSTQKLKINVIDDNNFKQGEKSNVWRKIEFTDRLSEPANWASIVSFLGKYSVKKHEFFIETTGDKWDVDFLTYIKSDLSLLGYYRDVCRIALIDYNKAHPLEPMKDENGLLVEMPL